MVKSFQKARSLGTIPQIWSAPQKEEEEDDPNFWDEVNESSWGNETGEIMSGSSADDTSELELPLQKDGMTLTATDLTTTAKLNLPPDKEKKTIVNPQLQGMQIEMDRLRSAMNITSLCGKPKILARHTDDYSKITEQNCPQKLIIGSRTQLYQLYTKLNQLFGPLEMQFSTTTPSIMIRHGNTTSRYIREFERDHVLERNNRYFFRRIPTPSLPTVSYFCLDLVRNSPSLNEFSYIINKATLTVGNEVISLPFLLKSINNLNDKCMVLWKSGAIEIFFERRALFLERGFRKVFDVTPLINQVGIVQIILDFLDLYKLNQWRDAERVCREKWKIKPQKKEIDATEKVWMSEKSRVTSSKPVPTKINRSVDLKKLLQTFTSGHIPENGYTEIIRSWFPELDNAVTVMPIMNNGDTYKILLFQDAHVPHEAFLKFRDVGFMIREEYPPHPCSGNPILFKALKSLVIRKEKSLRSPNLGILEMGETVLVNQVKGRRARLIKRMEDTQTWGWVSLYSEDSLPLLVRC